MREQESAGIGFLDFVSEIYLNFIGIYQKYTIPSYDI